MCSGFRAGISAATTAADRGGRLFVPVAPARDPAGVPAIVRAGVRGGLYLDRLSGVLPRFFLRLQCLHLKSGIDCLPKGFAGSSWEVVDLLYFPQCTDVDFVDVRAPIDLRVQ